MPVIQPTFQSEFPGPAQALQRLISIKGEAVIEYSGREGESATHGSARWLFRLSPSEPLKRQFSLDGLIPCVFDPKPLFNDSIFSSLERLSRNLGCDRDIGIILSNDPNVRVKSQRRGPNSIAVLAMNIEELSSLTVEELGGFGTQLSKVLAVTDHFNQSSPITNELLFFGRNDEIDRIFSISRSGENCGVFGLRKVGKTSVLNILRHRFRRESFPCDVVDLNRVHTRPVADTALAIVRTCISALEAVRVVVPGGIKSRLNQTSILQPGSPGHWENILDEVLELTPVSADGRQHIVLQIDESDHLVERGSPDQLDLRRDRHRFFGEFRGYNQSRQSAGVPFIASMFAGISRTLLDSPRMFGGDNQLFRFGTCHNLRPLEREEISLLVKQLGKRSGANFSDHRIIDELFSMLGGHPLLTRMACSQAMRQRIPGTVIPWRVPYELMQELLAARGMGSLFDEAVGYLSTFEGHFPELENCLTNALGSDRRIIFPVGTEVIARNYGFYIHDRFTFGILGIG